MHVGHIWVVDPASGSAHKLLAHTDSIADLALSALDRVGNVVYLPLKRGRNELVFAVTEYTGGWAYWARLDR